MADAYKLQIKLGTAEFTAEGPEKSVKDDYREFLKAIADKATAAAVAGKPSNGGNGNGAVERTPLEGSSLAHIYKRDGDIVSLRHLPDSPNRTADAALLLLYGYRELAGVEDVPVTKLNEGLRKSGLTFERIDRFLPMHSTLFRKGGQRSGSWYTLNNQGIAQVEQWLKDWK
jgi:hypothetical protein